MQTSTQADRLEREEEAEEPAKKPHHHHHHHHAKARAKKAGIIAKENAGNPVILGNLVLGAILTGGLGYGAYVKHRAGELSWKVAAVGVGIAGAFAAEDYFLSRYLFQKYPPKK